MIVAAVNSVEDINTNVISVYPIPSSGVFFFTAQRIIDQLEVTDLTGKQVFVASPKSKEFTIELGGRAAGVYFYSIKSGERNVRGKLVLSK